MFTWCPQTLSKQGLKPLQMHPLHCSLANSQLSTQKHLHTVLSGTFTRDTWILGCIRHALTITIQPNANVNNLSLTWWDAPHEHWKECRKEPKVHHIHGETQMKFMEQEKGNTHGKRRETTAPWATLTIATGRKGYCFTTMTSVCNKMIPIPPVQCQRASPSKAHRGTFEVARMREWVTCATCWSRNPDLQRRRRWCWFPPGAVILLPCPTYNHSGEAQVEFPTLPPKRMPLRFSAIIHRSIVIQFSVVQQPTKCRWPQDWLKVEMHARQKLSYTHLLQSLFQHLWMNVEEPSRETVHFLCTAHTSSSKILASYPTGLNPVAACMSVFLHKDSWGSSKGRTNLASACCKNCASWLTRSIRMLKSVANWTACMNAFWGKEVGNNDSGACTTPSPTFVPEPCFKIHTTLPNSPPIVAFLHHVQNIWPTGTKLMVMDHRNSRTIQVLESSYSSWERKEERNMS